MSQWEQLATETWAALLAGAQTPACLGWVSGGAVTFCPVCISFSFQMGVTPYGPLKVIKHLLHLTSSNHWVLSMREVGMSKMHLLQRASSGRQWRTPGWAPPQYLTLAGWLQQSQSSASFSWQGVVWGTEMCKTTCLLGDWGTFQLQTEAFNCPCLL